MNTGNITLSFTSPDEYDCPRSMSPNRQNLLYRHYEYEQRYTTSFPPSYVINIATGQQIDIVMDASHVVWSPDSRQIAFGDAQPEDNVELLYIYDLVNSELIELTTVDNIYAIQWDANYLYFVTEDDNTLYLSVWDGTQISIVWEMPLSEGSRPFAQLSPNAKWLFFQNRTSQTEQHTSYLLNTQTGEVHEILLEIDIVDLAWYPDETSVAVISGGQVIIYNVMNHTHEIIDHNRSGTYGAFFLRWSPSRKYLNYLVHEAGGTFNSSYTIYVYNTETDEVAQIDSMVSLDAGEVQWVSDIEFVYTHSEANEERSSDPNNLNDLYLYNMTTQQRTQLTATPDLDERFYCFN